MSRRRRRRRSIYLVQRFTSVSWQVSPRIGGLDELSLESAERLPLYRRLLNRLRQHIGVVAVLAVLIGAFAFYVPSQPAPKREEVFWTKERLEYYEFLPEVLKPQPKN